MATDAASPPSPRPPVRELTRPAARRVLEVVATAPSPPTVRDIADALGQHHTGVRAQLAALVDAGLVQAHTDPPSGRGRPARRYVPAPDPAEREAAGHRELVRLLMGLVGAAGFGPEEVRRFGEGQGGATARPGGGIEELAGAFDRLGFMPRAVDGASRVPDLVLDRCPFADGVEAKGGELICALHLGLARGIADRSGAGVEVEGLDAVDPRRAGCRLRLAPRG